MRKSVCNRILSVLLVVVAVVSQLPTEFLCTPKALEPEISNQSQATTTPSSDLPWDYDTLHITLSGEDVETLSIHSYDKVEIEATGLVENAAYQWQVEHPEKDGVWVDIYDGIERNIGVSLALVENVLRANGTAKLRCRAYTDTCAYLSNVVTVSLLAGDAVPALMASSEGGNAARVGENELDFVTVEIQYIKWEYVKHVDNKGVTTYVLEKTGSAYGSYVATILRGTAENQSSFSVSVPNPVIVGYSPSLIEKTGATMSNDTVHISLSNVTEDVVFEVEYRPARVNYSVHYYFQNIYDDLYVENTSLAPSVTLQGYTGDMPKLDLTQKTVEGFTSLFYEPDIIAGDGSTVFNVYYERNYYLMEFDCNGGYGTDTIYVRYGTYVAVADPVKSGWVFGGWDLVATDNASNTETLGDGQYNVLPQTLPAYNSAYKAIWNIAATTYTVVYWRENADDSKYSYWGSKQVGANSNDHVTATSHTSLTGVDLPETDYFTYNPEMTVAEESQRTDLAADGKVIVEGDGSTVLNVYFSRNVYTLQFNIGNNAFTIPEGGHQHSDGNCTYDVICEFPNHVHSDACVSILSCVIPEHDTHTAECLICKDVEHKHTEICLVCNQKAHTHGDACCKLSPHEHSTSCYTLSRGTWGSAYNGTPNGKPASNGIVQNNFTYYYQIGDTWYQITGLSNISSSANYYQNVTITKCQLPEHAHGDGSCDYSDCTQHVHTADCYVCGKLQHIHSAVCCSVAEHTHDISCYNPASGYTEGISSNSVIANNAIAAIADPKEGYIYRYNRNGTYHNFFYTSSGWYYLGTNNQYRNLLNGTISNPSMGNYTVSNLPALEKCGNIEHSHDDGHCVYCANEHTHHSDACFDCGLSEHTHTDSCYKDAIHTHTDFCYSWTCGASAHTHTDDCYSDCNKPEWYVEGTGTSTKYIIKAKYNQNIGRLWPTAIYFTSTKLTSWTISGISNPAVSKRVNMTPDLCNNAANANRTKTVSGSFSNSTTDKQTLYYMFESTNQTDPAKGDERRELDGVFYDVDIDYSQEVNYYATNWSQKEIVGMTPVSSGVKYESDDDGAKAFFYYKRSRVELHFHNVNEVVATYSDLLYGSKLNSVYTDALGFASAYVPPYPSVYEPGAYEFKGWYTTPECFDRTKVDWENMVMPESDLTLYAKWAPVKRNVYFYLTYEDIALNNTWETKDQYGNDVSYPIVVEHGAVLGTAYHYTPQRNEDYDHDGVPDYTFIGWFYMDEDNKKRFAPDTMEIKKDLKLFAEWQSLVDTEYTVEYVLKEAETINGVQYPAGTVLAVPTEGHSTAGRTKTFTAKAGDQLLEVFRNAAIFPLTNTHSILMDANSTQNTYVFEYVLDPEVYYKVRYVNKVTGEILDETDSLKTSNSIVTVKFKTIDGFVPEQFYIQKVLAYDGDATSAIADNVITFYYLPNEVSNPEALYNVEYYKYNQITGDYEQVQSEPGRSEVDSGVTVPVVTDKFSGFAYTKAEIITYTSETSYTTANKDSNVTTLSATMTMYGVVFRIYYDPVEYPYLIKFVEQGNTSHILGYGKMGSGAVYSSLADVNGEKATFESKQSYTAPSQITVDGTNYDIQTGTSQTQTLTIRIEENTTDAEWCKVNVLTFYYTRELIPVEYHIACTVPGLVGGQLSQSFEPDPANPTGCTAYVKPGFTFEGWFYDEACTQQVTNPAWISGTKITPTVDGIMKGEDGKEHFYALFKPIVTELTIEKTVSNDAECDNSFLFRVQGVAGTITREVDLVVLIIGNGEAVVKGLYCGSYTVTELTGWSWEYIVSDTASKSVTLVENPGDNKVSFQNAHVDPDWLGDESAVGNNNFE